MQTQQLTFTRFLAAIAIVIYHFGVNSYPFSLNGIDTIFHNGNVGVSFFYTLSGFVMMLAYYPKSEKCRWRGYMMNRIARIVPLYYVAFGIMSLYLLIRLSILKLPFTYTPQWSDALLNLTFMQSWIPNKALTYNTAAWSLSVEMFFYVIFPFLLNRFIKRYDFKKITIVIALFYFISQITVHLLTRQEIWGIPTLYWHFNPLLHVNSFLIGIWFGLLIFKRNDIKDNTLGIIISFGLTVVAILFKPDYIVLNSGIISIIYGYLIYLIATDNGFIKRLFCLKPLEFLGEASYGIYILQFPLYFFFTGSLNAIGIEMKSYYFFYYLVVLTLASSLSYLYIEKPLREKIKKIKTN